MHIYLREEQSCQISPQADLKRQSLGLSLKSAAQEEQEQQNEQTRFD